MNENIITLKAWNKVRTNENVIGYSKKILPKFVNGKEVGYGAIRVYVSKKKPLEYLREKDLVPESIDDFDTDVIEIGKLTAPPPTLTTPLQPATVDKTVAFRPVKLGISVGHWLISSGSLGMLYNYKGKIVAGSNAHVLTNNPSYTPNEIVEKRILQPGAYFEGQKEENIVGEYLWHQQLYPVGTSNCKYGKGIAKLLNIGPSLFNRNGRFSYTAMGNNNIDFAVYTPTVEHVIDMADGSITNEPFVGHLFAGSEQVGIICKVSYIKDRGFEPLVPTTEVKEGDKVRGSSFWCYYEDVVTDSSAVVQVNYGDFNALIQDVIIVHNNGTIRGGYSGSSWFKVG